MAVIWRHKNKDGESVEVHRSESGPIWGEVVISKDGHTQCRAPIRHPAPASALRWALTAALDEAPYNLKLVDADAIIVPLADAGAIRAWRANGGLVPTAVEVAINNIAAQVTPPDPDAELVEVMAKAAYEAVTGFDWRGLHLDATDRMRTQARAALAALRAHEGGQS